MKPDYRHPVPANARVWMDEDGEHVWFAHDCIEGRDRTMLPHPTWRRAGDKVQPSIDCGKCGVHSYFDLTIDAPRDGADR